MNKQASKEKHTSHTSHTRELDARKRLVLYTYPGSNGFSRAFYRADTLLLPYDAKVHKASSD